MYTAQISKLFEDGKALGKLRKIKVTILMISAKMATLGLLKIKVFWCKGCDVMISLYDVINKNLSRDSNFVVDVVMWLKFGNYSTSMREIIITSLL